jgi:hypothetical protein
MKQGTAAKKVDIEGVECRLKADMGSDVSTLQQEISKASRRDTTLRPYGFT